ncbi:MAG TPA: aminopeptidase P family protein [Deltaproteobacteria bacterium]|nr:aminopeptidase P family protein [Deltaproteobacteria bacterium]
MLKRLGACDLTPRAELERRIDGLRRRMAEGGIDFAVIIQNVDVFYFTGSLQKGTLVVPADKEPIFFVEKSLGRVGMETPLEITPIRRDKEIKGILKDRGLLHGVGAMELDVVPVSVFERFKSVVGYDRFVDISPLIRELRLRKSAFELEQIKQSGAIIEKIFVRAREVIKEGITEVEIDAELLAEGRRNGHQGFLRMRGLNQEMMNLYVSTGVASTIASYADVPIAGVGLTPAIAQGSSMNVVEAGVPVVVDYGGGYNGYITDETRVYVAGRLDEIFKRPYDVARNIIEDFAGSGKEGVDCTELFERAVSRVKKEGLQDFFMGHGEGQVSFIGHGLGLEINELPVITARHSRILEEGMVFALEPKFIFPGKGAIGIEVDFIVRKDRLERVTSAPVDIVYV